MNRFFGLCCGLLVMTCQAESIPETTLQKIAGVWQGDGKQDNNSRWTIQITISPNRYLIAYPSLNCGGELKFIKEMGNALIFEEYLTYGLNGCYNNGKTILIKDGDNSMRYYWYYENGGRKAAAGKLTRQASI